MKVANDKNKNVIAGSLSVAGNWNTKISTISHKIALKRPGVQC